MKTADSDCSVADVKMENCLQSDGCPLQSQANHLHEEASSKGDSQNGDQHLDWWSKF